MMMKKVFAGVLMGLLVSVSSFADVDLWSADSQKLPENISEELYLNFETAMPHSAQMGDNGQSTIELKNLYCEITSGYKTANPVYKCSYGINGEIPEGYSKNIYQLMVQAGFESDCDSHDGSCDIDPVKSMTCVKTVDWCSGVHFSCTLSI